MLIETSNNKEPTKDELGSSLDVLNRDTPENGHVSRNIRLSLLAADLVEPWVSVISVNNVALYDDVVPLSVRSERTCQSTKAVMVPKNNRKVVVEWTVGGAIAIDHTELWFARWVDIPESQLGGKEETPKHTRPREAKAGPPPSISATPESPPSPQPLNPLHHRNP